MTRKEKSTLSPVTLIFVVVLTCTLAFSLLRKRLELPPLKPVVVILVMPSTVDTARHPERVRTILSTWAAPSNERQNFDVQVRFVADEEVAGESIYSIDKSWARTTQLFKAFQMAMEEFNGRLKFVAKGDDITFWVPGNLDSFLKRRAEDDDYIGGNLLGINSRETFLSGGAGFVLHASLLQKVVGVWKENCQNKFVGNHFLMSSEDVALGKCISTEMSDMELQPALDLDSFQELFNVYDPVRALVGKYDTWYREYKANVGMKPRCCSPETITFHYVEPPLAEVLWDLLVSSPDTEEDTSRLINEQKWPDHTGGYTHRPTSTEQLQAFVGMMLAFPRQ